DRGGASVRRRSPRGPGDRRSRSHRSRPSSPPGDRLSSDFRCSAARSFPGRPMARVLIVDDSPSQLMGMKRIVEKLGHEILTAEDGAQGVEVAKREIPDLILMDVVMPNLNGFQATRSISKEPSTAHIPVILVTTKDQETDKVWGMRQGAKAYLTKPVNEAALIKLVNELLPG